MSGLAVLLAGCGGATLFLYLRFNKGIAVFNLIHDDYPCIGRQRLYMNQPTIDLNEFEGMVQSPFCSFVLDTATTKRLFGRNITVTLGDITMKTRLSSLLCGCLLMGSLTGPALTVDSYQFTLEHQMNSTKVKRNESSSIFEVANYGIVRTST